MTQFLFMIEESSQMGAFMIKSVPELNLCGTKNLKLNYFQLSYSKTQLSYRFLQRKTIFAKQSPDGLGMYLQSL